MKTSPPKLLTAVLWLGAALSYAAPVDAYIITQQSGSYAACSASFTTLDQTYYGCQNPDNPQGSPYNYHQNIKLVSIACNAGGCSPDTSVVYTSTVLSAGRKDVTSTYCGKVGWRMYVQTSCAC